MVGIAVLVAALIVAGIWKFFYFAELLWNYWYITIPVAVLIWFALLGLEFRSKANEDAAREKRTVDRVIPFTIKTRANPGIAKIRNMRRTA